MKTWTSILAAGAILAFAAPAGNAASTMIPRDPGGNAGQVSVLRQTVLANTAVAKSRMSGNLAAQIKALNAKNKALAAQKKALNARIKALAATIRVLEDRLRSVVPQPSGQGGGTAERPNTDCADYMVDCTDAQLCAIWGANCDLVPPIDNPPIDDPSSGESQTGTAPVDDGSGNGSENTAPPAEPVSGGSSPNQDDPPYEDC